MPASQRFAAWLVTGPAGHLVAGVADFAVLFWRLGAARLSARRRTGGSGS